MDSREHSILVQVCDFLLGINLHASFSALQGPVPYIKHLLSAPRIPFTAAYFGSLALTLYFAVGVSFPTSIC